MCFDKSKLQKLGVFVGMLIYAVILYVFQLGCPILRITGLPCPGCGMTRAWLSVLRLDFAAAFSYNPMFWAVPVLCLMLWFDGNIFPKKLWNNVLCGGIAIGFLLKWIFVLCNL